MEDFVSAPAQDSSSARSGGEGRVEIREEDPTAFVRAGAVPLGTGYGANMETSLRLGGESKGLRIHAKEKFPIGSNFLFQAHGEIDTSIGAPNYFAIAMRRFFPGLSANVGVGVHYDKEKKIGYTLRGKKSFPLTPNGLVGINIKGLLLTDQEYKVNKKSGAVELSWSIFNFRRDQDVRLKVGYEIHDKMPYFQVRENNWTVNAFLDGNWNVRFDL